MTVVHAITRQGAGLPLAHALAHAPASSHRDGHATAATEGSGTAAVPSRSLPAAAATASSPSPRAPPAGRRVGELCGSLDAAARLSALRRSDGHQARVRPRRLRCTPPTTGTRPRPSTLASLKPMGMLDGKQVRSASAAATSAAPQQREAWTMTFSA